MKLKIQEMNYEHSIGNCWIMFSDILDIRYHRMSTKKFMEKSEDKPDFRGFSAVSDKFETMMLVSATRRDGTTLGVAFTTIGYLLSDEGKTVETLKP